MTHGPEQTIRIRCPECSKPLQVSGGLAGKTGKCPSCGTLMKIPAPSPAAPGPERMPPVRKPPRRPGASQAETPGLPPRKPPVRAQGAPDPDVPQIQVTEPDWGSTLRQRSASEGGFFAPEKKGIQAGVLGGVTMIAISLVWFIGGLAAGIIFYDPPILFVIGLFALIQGLMTGNLAGKRRRRRSNVRSRF
jgi:phage FluMu protein Com